MDNFMTIYTDEYENEQNGNKVTGVTIIVDGKIKQVIDALIDKRGKNENYTQLIQESLVIGINEMINELK